MPGMPENGAVVWTGSSATGSYQSGEVANEQDNSSPAETAAGSVAEASSVSYVTDPE